MNAGHWGECEHAACILATEERLWNQSVTQRSHTHELWDVCGTMLPQVSWVATGTCSLDALHDCTPPPPPFSLFGTTLQPKTNWFNLCTTLHYHCYNKLFNSQFLAFTAAFAMVFSLINMHSLYTICQRVHGYVKCTNRTSTVGTAKINQSIILSTWQPCQKQSDCIHRTSCLATGCFHMSGCYGNTTMQTFPGIKGTCHYSNYHN